jgi:stress response protein SCP2
LITAHRGEGEPQAAILSWTGVVVDLLPGANAALPGSSVVVALDAPVDLSALVLDASGSVSGDADMVFWNAPSAPGVRVTGTGLEVTPSRLRGGAATVVVVASLAHDGLTLGALPPLATVLSDGSGRPFARLTPPRLGPESVVLLVEIYRRDGRWRVRAVGQGYADGLAGLARDFGVDVDDPAPAGGLLDAVITATNAERARLRLGLLTEDPRLTRAAQAHSEDMVRRAFFAHENPDGRQVWDRAGAAGYPYRKVAENIAAGQPTARDVVRGWMDSPGHRANILDPELTQIGVGHALGGSYGVCWTQVFGTPR